MKTILNLLIDLWPLLGPVAYEIVVRLWPTKWNISILDNVWKILNAIIPNNRIPDGKESGLGTNAAGKVVNRVKVKIGRHILRALFIVCLFSSFAQAQIWQNFKGVRLVNNSDTTLQLAVQGSIFYDDTNDKFWGRDNWGWKQFATGSVTGAFWELATGGNLTGNNTITLGANTLLFTGNRTSFTGSATRAGINIGARAANPTDLSDGDLWINSTTGYIGARFGSATRLLINSATSDVATAGLLPFVAATNTGRITTETAFSYNSTTNLLSIVNAAGTHTTSLFGGEIQFDFPGGSDDVTINNAGISASGLAVPYEIVSTSGFEIDGNIDLTPTSSASELHFGTYTPTLTNQSNLSASSVVASSFTYIRVGNTVKVEGAVNITPTVDATLTQLGISLPITSNLSVISGKGVIDIPSGATVNVGYISPDIINDVARFNIISNSTGAQFWYIDFQYIIQ